MGDKSRSPGGKVQNFFDVKLSIAISFMSWPFCYLVDSGFTKVDQNKRTFVMMSVGFALLATIILVVRKMSKQNNWIRYVFVLFAFTSMIDTIIALEFKGWIRGFMSQYLDIGEPYLSSPWGYAITLFDGIGFYPMYLALIHLLSNRIPWRSLGIYWASGIFNSMIILLVGVATGKHSPTFCTFLNVPYALIPLIIGIRLLFKEKQQHWSVERVNSGGLLFDLTIAICLVFSIWIVFVKGMLSLGSKFQIFQDVLSHERALLDVDPAPFAIIQSLVFIFYALPILIVSLAYVFRSRKPQWVWDLALINGGLFLQAQFSFIATALDSQTSLELRADPLDCKFWVDNLTLLIIPQVLLWRLYESHVNSGAGVSSMMVSHTYR